MMLEFILFCESYHYHEQKVNVNPNFVESVVETTSRSDGGFFKPVAYIKMASGERHKVYDYGRKVASKILAAQQAAL